MPGRSSDDLLALFDSAPLNRRYWVSFILLAALFVVEFFDFLVVSYLLAVLAPQWHLTYGQSAVMLYSGGVGAILGALIFGGLSDAWGRKSTMIIGTFICAASSGLMGIVPSGAWEVFAILRFFIGVGPVFIWSLRPQAAFSLLRPPPARLAWGCNSAWRRRSPAC